MDDSSPMPFGKHKGMKMVNVPARYLLWLHEQDWIEDWPDLNAYIIDNLDVLQMETGA